MQISPDTLFICIHYNLILICSFYLTFFSSYLSVISFSVSVLFSCLFQLNFEYSFFCYLFLSVCFNSVDMTLCLFLCFLSVFSYSYFFIRSWPEDQISLSKKVKTKRKEGSYIISFESLVSFNRKLLTLSKNHRKLLKLI